MTNKCSTDACDPVLAEALQEMAEITHPYYFIKNAEKSKSYIQEICKELPAAWTVCLLSTARPGVLTCVVLFEVCCL